MSIFAKAQNYLFLQYCFFGGRVEAYGHSALSQLMACKLLVRLYLPTCTSLQNTRMISELVLISIIYLPSYNYEYKYVQNLHSIYNDS